ncbi:2OG-Fe(II) oxygenase-like protein 8 [Elsinoe australis]|uniref:2OG-Fe(II) oxygenase-like protein 8 n=1 Tax=Elsinoe australis TaxID=40998 RepID=A0A4U7AT94_9PEZI|nr:2OG-Fe(II) oxygenase-like protein 8 [Elsinoe australis]
MASNSSLGTGFEYAAILAVLFAFFGGINFSKRDGSDKREEWASRSSVDKTQSLVFPDGELVCPQHNFDVHIFSVAPLIIHVSNFVTQEEARHLIALSEQNWQPSTVFNAGQEYSDDKVRKSEKARIERDKTVQCIEARALAFQGWPKDTFIERLWTQRYTAPDGHYAHHYDWGSANPNARRASTFMVYLEANCTGGSTHFPLLQRPSDPRWCDYIECPSAPKQQSGNAEVAEQEAGGSGVSFRPVPYSAVFWENFDSEGRGWKEGLHAGNPVLTGTKIGLNIWSWYQKGLKPEQIVGETV